MGPLDLSIHLLNFLAPALFVSATLGFLAGWVIRRTAGTAKGMQFGANLIVGVAVLLGGVWLFRADGKMATYAALVVCCGTSQWLLSRAWRK